MALTWHNLFWRFQAVSQHVTETQKRYVNLDNKGKKNCRFITWNFCNRKSTEARDPLKKGRKYGTAAVQYMYVQLFPRPLPPWYLFPLSLVLASCPPPPPPESSDLSKTKDRVWPHFQLREKGWKYVAYQSIFDERRGPLKLKLKRKQRNMDKSLIYQVEKQINRIFNLD